ncbi:dihydrolipoyl dehydrogenase family protein [Bacillus fonticola]|uniref:dihydrolipoyl dehydrogenase family protein n=1 Tax=Bacillus fonticola TaxID=2728853 RepID=UPI001474E66C|nr:FAD-dependent oxidoreductase [Bacillus fonticola]
MVVGELTQDCELVVVGGGPAGYTAAIRAAQLGKTVTLIERRALGGVCLHEGCMPSKVWAHAAAEWSKSKHRTQLGIPQAKGEDFQFQKLASYQKRVLRTLEKGVQHLLNSLQIDVLEGDASFLDEHRLFVQGERESTTVKFEQCIIATGTVLQPLDSIKVDGRVVRTMRQLYDAGQIPEELTIVGHEPWCVEAACTLATLGVPVTWYQTAEWEWDATLVSHLEKDLKGRSVTHHRVRQVTFENEEERVSGEACLLDGTTLSFETACLAVSLRAVVPAEELGLLKAGIDIQENVINVDEQGRTSTPHIFAVGSVTGTVWANDSIAAAKRVAATVCGQEEDTFSYGAPRVLYTNPGIASIGLTEEEARHQFEQVSTGTFSLSGNGWATVTGARAGFVKWVVDESTDRVVGVHIVADQAQELIASGTLAFHLLARKEDILQAYQPHPGVGEALTEAMEALQGQAIHQVNLSKQVVY